ncbi:HEAT repeat domain-containing protein [Streptomyces sp. NBC_01465]|uniref:HEAT repeat domain-containing protein n=1 Tax=Streptomyces sp. NBC_01465 TaxID=2903878 RepID=UPI002E2EE747|nr:HEAT repeat domain-containing protein [Streptomyces sp. NBC_01465]
MTESESARLTRILSGLPTAARELLLGTDWESLQHAYGSGEDIPLSLCSLVDEDPEVRSEALAALDMGVLHQGSLYSVTAPAALFVAAILDHPVSLTEHEGHFPCDDGPPRSLRAALLVWLGQVAESAAYGEDPVRDRTNWQWEPWHDETRREYAPDELAALYACRETRPTLYDAVEPFLSSPDAHVREAALGAALPLLLAPELADRVPWAVTLLRARLGPAAGRGERASVARALGVWRIDTSDLLDDPDPAVRVCAALGPAHVDRPRALGVLLDALRDPRTTDGWFPEPLPGLDGWFRFTVLRSALALAETFEEVAPVAVAIVAAGGTSVTDHERGPILLRAFPGGYDPTHPLTAAQRALLRAFVDTDETTGSIAGNWLWFRTAGLPENREGIAALL